MQRISLCHACSDHEILRDGNGRAGGERRALLATHPKPAGLGGASVAKQLAVRGRLGKDKVGADVLVEGMSEEEVTARAFCPQ